VVQYQLAHEESNPIEDPLSYIATAGLGAILGRLAGGHVFRPISAGFKYGPEAIPNAIDFIASYTHGWGDLIQSRLWSGVKSFAASSTGNLLMVPAARACVVPVHRPGSLVKRAV
jgi:hypothetical protein